MKSKTTSSLIWFVCVLMLIVSFNNCSRYGLFPSAEDRISGIGSKGVETGNPMAGSVALPKVFLDSSYPKLPSNHKILTVGAKGRLYNNCQSAVDAARPGDEVVIDAGFVCTHLVLPDKGNLQDFIVIRTADLPSLPPEGKRLSRTEASHLAILETNNYEFAVGVEDVPSGSSATISPNHYYLLGLEIRVNPLAKTKNGYIVKLRKTASKLEDLPHDIVIARSWIHGNPDQEVRTGIEMNGLKISITDSIIEDIHLHNETSEGIAGWDSAAGPYKITNNEIAVAGVGLLLGWQSSIPELIPSDIEVRGNYFHKLDQWRQPITSNLGLAGYWAFGNPVVLRSAQRVLFDANTFANDWSHIPATSSYMGHVFWLKPNGFGQPWARVQDITITNNVMHDVGGGFGIFYQDPSLPEVVTQRISIQNNVAYNLDSKNDAGFIWLQGHATGSVVFNHNTFLSRPKSLPALIMGEKSGTFAYFTFTNNLINDDGLGIVGLGSAASGGVSLTTQFPSVVLHNNALTGQQAANYVGYESSNYFPANLSEVGFSADPSMGVTDLKNLQLLNSSPYFGAGSDGSDIGANILQINQLSEPH